MKIQEAVPVYYGKHYDSPLGDILLAADEKRLTGLWIAEQKDRAQTMPENMNFSEENPVLEAAADWLDAYFAGKQPDPLALVLAPQGSAFRKTVWKRLLEIPCGETVTYGEVARDVAARMGRAMMSAQAVGGAVGHNPISIIIPCHRVVGTGGSLTGYAGGIQKKVWLLTHEGADMSRLFVPKKGTAL